MADTQLFSTKYPILSLNDCSDAIRDALRQLRTAFGPGKMRVINWSEHYVGAAITVQVSLPTRGPVRGIDIQEQEPLLILFHKTDYPHRAPMVCSDRRDFPAARLPHLNPTLREQPASLCLHRGSINDWFAEHSIISLVERARGWLSDAASNMLIREHDHFEPTRTEIERRVGSATYDPTLIEQYIRNQWAAGKERGSAVIVWSLLSPVSRTPSLEREPFPIRLQRICTFEDAAKTRISLIQQLYPEAESRGKKDQCLFGILVWSDRDQVCRDYFGWLPNTLLALVMFAEQLGLLFRDALNQYLDMDLQLMGGVPVTLAIQRPQPLIGSDSTLEFLNLLLAAGGDHTPVGNKWRSDTDVWLLGHRMPLTIKRAKELSASFTGTLQRVLLVGCGALGSKVALHLARAGMTEMTLIDYDDLAPHNLVRHGLLADSVGQNKAEMTKKAITDIYSGDPSNMHVTVYHGNAVDVLFGERSRSLKDHGWILDCTASPSVLNMLLDSRLNQAPRVLRIEIADQGRLGFLMIEGVERNPRLDDLQAVLYDRAIEDDRLATWLRQHRSQVEQVRGPVLDEISIGIGCGSDTMRMADDVVSYHAAAAAISVRDTFGEPVSQAGIQVSYWGDSWASRGKVEFAPVEKTLTLMPQQASGWKVRISRKLHDQIQDQMRRASPDETGGLLVGFVHLKRRVVYVTRALDAPDDSESWPYAFRMGIKDIPAQIEHIHERTGGLIQYVGEWHSHPHGGNRLSDTDKAAVRHILKHFRGAEFPFQIMVVTPAGCFPHLFNHHGR